MRTPKKLLISVALLAGSVLAAEPDRLFVVGDVHGEHAGFTELLSEVGLTDEQGRWSGGDAWLVSLGDVVDRGPDGVAVIRTLMRLQQEAAAAGGRVELVLGNHEVMNLTGELEYISEADYAASGGPEARRALFAPDGEIGAWLLQRPVLMVVGDTVLVHGGLPESLAGGDPSARIAGWVDAVHTYAVAWSRETADGMPPFTTRWSSRPAALAETGSGQYAAELTLGSDDVFDIEGPMWNRRAVMCHPMLETAPLEASLAALGASRAVVGHTPTGSRNIETAYDGQLVMADTGMYAEAYGGTPQALLIEGGALRAYDASTDAWYTPAPRPRAIGERPGGMSDDELEAFLATAPIIHSQDLGVGVTRPQRVTLERDGIRVRALFKAEDTGAPRGSRSSRRRAIENSDRWQYELAAYRLDRLMGLDLVPVTVTRTHQGQEGMLQFWIEGAINELDRQQDGVAVESWCPVAEQYTLMNAFDALIHNVDRTLQNVMYIREDWSLVLIDASRGFRLDRGFPNAIGVAERRMPRELAERFRALDSESLNAALGELLDRDQIRAILQRRDRILDEWEIF